MRIKNWNAMNQRALLACLLMACWQHADAQVQEEGRQLAAGMAQQGEQWAGLASSDYQALLNSQLQQNRDYATQLGAAQSAMGRLAAAGGNQTPGGATTAPTSGGTYGGGQPLGGGAASDGSFTYPAGY